MLLYYIYSIFYIGLFFLLLNHSGDSSRKSIWRHLFHLVWFQLNKKYLIKYHMLPYVTHIHKHSIFSLSSTFFWMVQQTKKHIYCIMVYNDVSIFVFYIYMSCVHIAYIDIYLFFFVFLKFSLSLSLYYMDDLLLKFFDNALHLLFICMLITNYSIMNHFSS